MAIIVATVICPSTGRKFQAELNVVDKAKDIDSPLVQEVFWKGRDIFEKRKDLMLNHNIKLQIQLSNYKQGDNIELTVKQNKGRRIKGHATEFTIAGICNDNGLIIIDNFEVECDFKEDNQDFGKIQIYHKDRKIEEFEENFGWEYIRENEVTKIFVNLRPKIDYVAFGCTEKEYKNAIQEQFKRTLELSSNGLVTGKIFFTSPFTTLEPPQATVSLKVSQEIEVEKKDEEVSGTGLTWMNNAESDTQATDDGLLLMNLGETSVHELLHTLRLDHPQTTTQASDCKIIHESGVSFKTTPKTDSKIYYNIMIYGFLRVNDKLLSNLWQYKRPEYLTKGQLKFIIEEIDRQKNGEGSQKTNHNYSNYWSYPPGEYVNLNKR